MPVQHCPETFSVRYRWLREIHIIIIWPLYHYFIWFACHAVYEGQNGRRYYRLFFVKNKKRVYACIICKIYFCNELIFAKKLQRKGSQCLVRHAYYSNMSRPENLMYNYTTNCKYTKFTKSYTHAMFTLSPDIIMRRQFTVRAVFIHFIRFIYI